MVRKHAARWIPAHAGRDPPPAGARHLPGPRSPPVTEIKAPELLACIRRIEARGSIETAHRALRDCGQVFPYAIATGRAERNPAADLRGALPPAKVKHHAAITDPKAIGALLRAIDGYQGICRPVRPAPGTADVCTAGRTAGGRVVGVRP